jgi:hypothetical protein
VLGAADVESELVVVAGVVVEVVSVPPATGVVAATDCGTNSLIVSVA